MPTDYGQFKKTMPFIKVDEAKREVWTIVTAEVPDKDGEVCDYQSTKPYYQALVAEMSKATNGINICPLREMHQLNAVGRGISIDYRDSDKEIFMGFKVVDDNAWKKVEERVLTGVSQGGSYIDKWRKDGYTYYTSNPSEVSLVDNPCLGIAHFAYIKADGSIEICKAGGWVNPNAPVVRRMDELIARLSKAKAYSYGTLQIDIPPDSELGKSVAELRANVDDKDVAGSIGKNVESHITVRYGLKGNDTAAIKEYLARRRPSIPLLGKAAKSFAELLIDHHQEILMIPLQKSLEDLELRLDKSLKKKVKYLVTESDGTTHLPYTDSDGSPNHNLMGAAWAALHSGYRGNKYDGPDKDKAIAHLKEIYSSEGMDTPSEKAVKLSKLFKSLYQVQELAQVLSIIQNLRQNSIFEGFYEQDEGDMEIADKFGVWLTEGCELLQQLVAHETAEIIEPPAASAPAA